MVTVLQHYPSLPLGDWPTTKCKGALHSVKPGSDRMGVMDNAQLEYPSHPLETLTCRNGT